MLEDRGAASCVQFDQALAAFPWLALIACALFGGVYDPSKLRFTDRLIASLPASDVRDWTEIRAWAHALAAKVAPALHETRHSYE